MVKLGKWNSKAIGIVILILYVLITAMLSFDKRVIWKFKTFKRFFWHGYCQAEAPLIHGNQAFVSGGYSWNNQVYLFALDRKTGKRQWRKGPFHYVSSPRLSGRQVILVTQAAPGKPYKLLALDKDSGSEIWSFNDAFNFELSKDNRVIASLWGKGEPDVVVILSSDKGEELKRIENVSFHSIAENGEILVLGKKRVLKIFAADSYEELNQVQLPARNTSPIVKRDNILLFGAEEKLENSKSYFYLYAFDLISQTVKWKFKYSSVLSKKPMVDGEVVYTGSGLVDQALYAIDLETGKLKWKLKTGWDAYPIMSEGVLYAATGDDFIAVDPNSGKKLWTFSTGDLTGEPVISDGAAYFGSDDCNFYALRIGH